MCVLNWPTTCLFNAHHIVYVAVNTIVVHPQLHLKATPTGPALSLSPDCPHRLVRDSLEALLRETGSLPLLLQGVCASEEPLKLIVQFAERIPAISLSAAVPSQIQLAYDNLYPIYKDGVDNLYPVCGGMALLGTGALPCT